MIADSVSEWAELGGRLLVVYDGRCGLCNRAVRWFLRRDTLDRMRFAPSELPRVADLLVRLGVTVEGGDGPGSIVVVSDLDREQPRALMATDAVAALLGEMPGGWPLIGLVLRALPRALRDGGYGLIARWRYRIWGRLASCPVPTAAERGKFL